MNGFVKSLGAAGLAFGLTTGASFAATVDVEFAFGDVTGVFYGLDDSDGISQATSFDIDGFLGTYSDVSTSIDDPLGRLPGTFEVINSFEFLSEELQSVTFEMSITGIEWPNAFDFDQRTGISLLDINSEFSVGQLIESQRNIPFTFTTSRGEVVFNVIDSSSPSPVPLPASVLLLLAGLGSVFGLKRKKRKIA